MRTVAVYADQGVDGGALKQLVCSLKLELATPIKRVDAKALVSTSWEKEIDLLIVPGGRDIFYHAALDGKGTEKIRRYVENGGNYLGICAGAYFACESIEFEKGGPIEVCAERSLKFFPGIAKGPAYGPNKYSCENARGVEAASISWGSAQCPVYFNGGCQFEEREHYPWVRTISRYLDLPGQPPAMLEIEMGKGLVFLSGVHIEYAPRYLNRDDPFLSRLIPIFEEVEAKRRHIFRSILEKFGFELIP